MPQTRCKQFDYKSKNARLPVYNQPHDSTIVTAEIISVQCDKNSFPSFETWKDKNHFVKRIKRRKLHRKVTNTYKTKERLDFDVIVTGAILFSLLPIISKTLKSFFSPPFNVRKWQLKPYTAFYNKPTDF